MRWVVEMQCQDRRWLTSATFTGFPSRLCVGDSMHLCDSGNDWWVVLHVVPFPLVAVRRNSLPSPFTISPHDNQMEAKLATFICIYERVYLHVFECVRKCVCMDVVVCVYVFVCMCVCEREREIDLLCLCVYVCFVCICVCMCFYVCVCVNNVCVGVLVCIYLYLCVFVCVCMCLYV